MKKIYSYLIFAISSFTIGNSYSQTAVVVDVVAGSNGSNPNELTTIGNKLFFFYSDPVSGGYAPAYISANGEVVKLKWPAGLISDGYEVPFKELNGNTYWIQNVYDNNQFEFYEGLATMRNDSIIMITNASQSVNNFEVYGNKIYMSADSDSTGYELYSYDETNIELVSDIFPGTIDSSPDSYMLHDGKLYFGAYNSSFQNTLFEFDGTTVTDLNIQGTLSINEKRFQSLGQDLYFLSSVSNPYKLIHLSTSTYSADTIYNLLAGSSNDLYTESIISVDNEIYIKGFEYGVFEYKLFKYNQLTDSIEVISNELDQVSELANYNDTLFIRARNTTTFSIDLYYIIPGVDTAVLALAGNVGQLTALNGDLYFVHNDGGDEEPWRWNHGAAEQIADINLTGYSYARDFEVFQGKLVMSANDGNIGYEIYFICNNVTDPTAPATQIACEASVVSDLNVTGTNLIYFDADTLGNVISDMPLTASGSVYVENHEVVCTSERIEVPFTVSMLPNSAATHLGSGMLKVINPSASYQWVDCATSNPVAGATSQTFQVPNNGSYQCIVTNADGCSATSDCIYVINLSVEENLANTVAVYPNPAKEMLNFSSQELIGSIQVYTLAGELVSTELVNASTYSMDANSLNNGMYFVSVFDTNNALVSKQKIVINK